ncbi:hypothetical protein [Chamaesiphon minutus]|uniref:hypothetical protein n=1 Tax=Chamaesiphon minutus TaxID=1173032 RepID=UPI0002F43B34|nr:hypothetical protein [Chamaesiphon minutus]
MLWLIAIVGIAIAISVKIAIPIGRVGARFSIIDLSKYRNRGSSDFFDEFTIAKVSLQETFFVLAIVERADRSRSWLDSGCIRTPEARLRQSKIDCLEDYKKNINLGYILIY